MSAIGGVLWWPLWLFVAAYAAALGAAAAVGAVHRREPCVLLAAVAFAVMHHAWPLGYLAARCERPAQ